MSLREPAPILALATLSMTKTTNLDVTQILEQLAPLSLAEDYDNVGLIIGESHRAVNGILTTLDITHAVLREALELGANLIVSHHPVWFRARKNLQGDDFTSELVLFAIRNELSIYASHTNLDSVGAGVNHAFVEKLQLQNSKILSPHSQSVDPSSDCQTGLGMIGDLTVEHTISEFLTLVKNSFHCSVIRHSYATKTKIKRVAVCGGAGSFLLQDAIKQEADAFITSDVTYHKFFDAEIKGILYLDIGHYESEQFTALVLAEYLSKHLPNVRVQATTINTNPVRYFS